jgi:hypothetical protein
MRFFEGRPVADQMKPEAGPLTVCPNSPRRQPDLGHEVPAGQFGGHVSVDLVCLGGQRCQTLRFHRIGDCHLPAPPLEGVVDEA